LKFDCDGVQIAFSDVGNGRPVLFVHGHPFNRSMWDPQVPSLRWKYRVIAPDLRGYGESDAGEDPVCTQALFATDVVRLLDHLGVGRVCIIGLSMGGQIAMEFVRAYPERTAGVVFAATSPAPESRDGVLKRNQMADRFLAEGPAVIGCEMLPRLIGTKTMQRSPLLAASVYEMICSTSQVGAAAALRGRAMRADYRQSIAEIACPCLVVSGEDDGFTTVEEAIAMHERVPDSQLHILPGIGHLPNLEDEDVFNRHLHSFLARVFPSDA
jgi:pimeloyl-ACP methyl ester carboxylesterase